MWYPTGQQCVMAAVRTNVRGGDYLHMRMVPELQAQHTCQGTGHEKWGPRKRLRCSVLGTVGTASCLRVEYWGTREFGTSLPCNIVNGTDGD